MDFSPLVIVNINFVLPIASLICFIWLLILKSIIYLFSSAIGAYHGFIERGGSKTFVIFWENLKFGDKPGDYNEIGDLSLGE